MRAGTGGDTDRSGPAHPPRGATIRCTPNQPKQHTAINIPSGRVSAAPAKHNETTTSPRRLAL